MQAKCYFPVLHNLMEFTDHDEGPMWMVSDERAFHKSMVQNHKFVWQTQVRAELIYSLNDMFTYPTICTICVM